MSPPPGGCHSDLAVCDPFPHLVCRVVLHGERMIQAIKPSSVEVFDFKTEYELTEQEVGVFY